MRQILAPVLWLQISLYSFSRWFMVTVTAIYHPDQCCLLITFCCIIFLSSLPVACFCVFGICQEHSCIVQSRCWCCSQCKSAFSSKGYFPWPGKSRWIIPISHELILWRIWMPIEEGRREQLQQICVTDFFSVQADKAIKDISQLYICSVSSAVGKGLLHNWNPSFI